MIAASISEGRNKCGADWWPGKIEDHLPLIGLIGGVGKIAEMVWIREPFGLVINFQLWQVATALQIDQNSCYRKVTNSVLSHDWNFWGLKRQSGRSVLIDKICGRF
ncbi:MAG: hypothetical protein WAK96_02120 [Desulfobaccales bacterium]